MNTMVTKLTIAATAGILLTCHPISAQILPPAPKAASVTILQGPAVESARHGEVIITWTSNNPGGTDSHFGVIKYGTSPSTLDQTATSPIRLNRGHSQTVFRVALDGLNPQTVYYYTVDSMGSDGTSDGVQGPVSQFTAPAADQ